MARSYKTFDASTQKPPVATPHRPVQEPPPRPAPKPPGGHPRNEFPSLLATPTTPGPRPSIQPLSPVPNQIPSASGRGGEGDVKTELSSTVILDASRCLVVPLELCHCFFMIVLHLDVVVLILSGGAFIVATVGLVGCVRQIVKLLDVYSLIMFFLITVVSLFTVAVTMLPDTVRKYIKEQVTTDYIVSYRENPDLRKAVDEMQTSFNCCGLTDNSYMDWDANMYFHCDDDNPSVDRCSVPSSCCLRENSGTVQRDCGRMIMLMLEKDAAKVVYTQGCADAVHTYVSDHMFVIVCCCILFNLAVVLLFTMSMNLSWEIKELAAFYDGYFDAVYEGQLRMVRRYPSLFKDKDVLLDGVAKKTCGKGDARGTDRNVLGTRVPGGYMRQPMPECPTTTAPFVPWHPPLAPSAAAVPAKLKRRNQ